MRVIRRSQDRVRWHDKNLLMNQAVATITASLLLWYLLSTMRGGMVGPGTSHSSPTHPSLLAGVIIADIPLPVKYYRPACLHTSVLSARPEASLVSLTGAMACLLFIRYIHLSHRLTVCLFSFFLFFLRTCIGYLLSTSWRSLSGRVQLPI